MTKATKTFFVLLISLSFVCGDTAIADSHDDVHKSDKKKSKKSKKSQHKNHKHKAGSHDDEEHHDDEEDSHDHSGHDDHDDGGHGEHGEESFGEGKAITEVKNEGESFKLALEAQSLLGLGFGVIEKSVGRGVFMVPTKSLIFFNDEKGIFVKAGEWFKLIDVELVKKGSNWSQVKSNELSVGQKIVVAGTGLLRVAHLQASGQGGKGHAH